MSKHLPDGAGGDSPPASRARRKLIGAAGMVAGAGVAAAATTVAQIGASGPAQAPIGGAPPPRRSLAAGSADADRTGRINVKDYGARGDGSSDDTAAVVAARDAVFASRNGNGWLTHHLYFPAGVYRITRADALLPRGVPGEKINGYTIEGQGKRSSELLFDAPAGNAGDRYSGNLLTAHGRVRQLRVREISFRSARAGLNWMYCWSSVTGGQTNQDFAFDDVEWRGPWNRVIGLDGDDKSNLNSEWSFNRCHLANDVVLGDAFLHSGMSPTYSQQDQFLNFWFRDCKFEYRSGTLLRFARGGYINVYGGSWIQCNDDPNVASVFFDLPPGPHNNTVKTLLVSGVRFELRSRASKLMDCGWDARNASLSFIACTDAALAHTAEVGGNCIPVTYRPRNGDMPFVKWQSCQLMGRHESFATANRERLLFEQCNTLNAPMEQFVLQR